MALELISPNQGYVAARSPKALHFRKSGLISVVGVKARMVIHVKTSFASSGDKLHIEWSDKSVEWEFGTYTGEDPNILPVQGVMSLHDWCNEMAGIIKRHPDVYPDWDVTNGVTFYSGLTDGFIVLEAINAGNLYTPAYGANNTTSPGTLSLIVNGVDEVINENYNLDGNLHCLSDLLGEFKKVKLPILIVGHRNGDYVDLIYHELSAAFTSQLGFDKPEEVYKPFFPSKSIGIAYFDIREQGDVRPVRISPGIDFNRQSHLFFVLNSAMPLFRFNPAKSLIADVSAVSDQRQWLTNFPLTRLVGRDQPNWLTICTGEATAFTVAVQIFYTDGTTHDADWDHEFAFVHFVTVPVGIKQLGLDTINPSKTILKYSVTLTSDSEETSESVNYIVDQRYVRNSRYLLFKNNYGFPEVLRCIGDLETGLQSTRNRTESVLTEQSRTDKGTVQMSYNEYTKVYSFSTGWMMSKKEADQFAEILLSSELFEIPMPLVPKNSDFAPYKQPYNALELVTDKIELYEDRTFNYGVKWQMRQGWADNAYNRRSRELEKIYPDVIEFVIKKTSNTGATPEINLTGVKNEWLVSINGIESTASSISFPADWPGDYYVKVQGYQLSELSVVVSDLEADLELIKYQSLNLTWLGFQTFNKISSTYLSELFGRPVALQSFFLYGNDFDIDGMLQQLVTYHQDSGSLIAVDLMGPTPSDYGYALKDWLDANGVSVTTV